MQCYRESKTYENCQWHEAKHNRRFVRCDEQTAQTVTATGTATPTTYSCVIQLPVSNIFQAQPHPLADTDCAFQPADAADAQPAGCPLNKQCFQWLQENFASSLADATVDGTAITCSLPASYTKTYAAGSPVFEFRTDQEYRNPLNEKLRTLTWNIASGSTSVNWNSNIWEGAWGQHTLYVFVIGSSPSSTPTVYRQEIQVFFDSNTKPVSINPSIRLINTPVDGQGLEAYPHS